ncbi:MAG: SH3 domain-containing protein [Blautia sp.]|nr:SH3 domain-containing protein [Blautia sp.]
MKKNRFASILVALALTFSLLAAGFLPLAGAVSVNAGTNTYRVNVASGYLALRTAPAYAYENEIGELYNSDTVDVLDYSGTYWYVYSPKYGRNGYVNSSYLVYAGSSGPTYTSSSSSSSGKPAPVTNGIYGVNVASGYLALRTSMEYNDANIIGELYNTDTVQYMSAGNADYWYVYSPRLVKYGYVNCSYLYFKENPATGSTGTKPSTGSTGITGATYRVSVDRNYLALRSAMSFDASNEIGKLYTGDTVNFMKNGNSTYWYVYSPKHDAYGYVNKDYLSYLRNDYASGSVGTYYTISVPEGYLALRSTMEYKPSNVIGKLYSGDTVEFLSDGNGTYWYVYSPKLKAKGYVNRVYLHY